MDKNDPIEKRFLHVNDLPKVMAEADRRIGMPLEERISPIRTWMPSLDRMTLGFHPGSLYVLGGRPGDGKTSFATTVTANIIKHSIETVLFISTEMTEVALILQVAEAHAEGVPTSPKNRKQWPNESNALRRSHMAIGEAITESRLSVLHVKKLDMEGIKRAIRHHTRILNDDTISLVIIDQVNRIHRPDKARHGYAIATEALLNDLEEVASDSHVPLLLVSQLNRGADTQERPTMSNIKHSGGLEEYAHCVLLLNRQGGYEAEIIVAKNRDGSTGFIPAEFSGESHTWSESIERDET